MSLRVRVGNYTDYERTRADKNLSNTRSQDLINKERKHIEETIQKLQVGIHAHTHHPHSHHWNCIVITTLTAGI